VAVSKALAHWQGARSRALDQISSAHARVGGTSRGRRYATEQINHAYAMLLSSQFQGFCRDLHSECADFAVGFVPAPYREILRSLLVDGRKIDRGNPNPGNIGSDFGRFGVEFWTEVRADRHGNDRRQEILMDLNEWRNAIAHQDFHAGLPGGTATLHLQTVQAWRRAISRLAVSFDSIMRNYLYSLTNTYPW
jgi:hypothetical protein